MDSSGPSGCVHAKGNQNIQVYLRVRPLSVREHTQRSTEMVEAVSNRDLHVRQVHDTRNAKKFSFDRVFGTNSKQNEVYSYVVAPLINEVLSGYNCTVFAYGQTGTGKTHTMVGDESPAAPASWEDDTPLGIIPRAVVHLFDELRMNDVEFSMRISYLELYNEELCDLLATEDNRIRIFDDSAKKGSVIVHGLEEIPVHCKDDVYKLLAKGQERRKTAQTLMNAQSSRSHTVFSIVVYTKESGLDGEEMLKTGKLNLVDLAGSENITKAGSEKGIRTREAVNINQSLLTLGRVITALVERQPHVPHRESKLTRLLQESLGGRTKTSIIATISPGHKDLEETLNTLDYAHRAKNIQNRPEINQCLTKKTVLKDYTEEIDRLKRDLMAAREKNGIYLAEETFNDMTYKLDGQTKELTEKTLAIRAMKEEMEKKDSLFEETRKHLDHKIRELKVTADTLSMTNLVLRDTKDTLKMTEQRCEESSHLVQVHEKTERELTGQARSLLQVADGASSDTQGLHEALKRRKIVDGQIHKTVETFAEGFNGEIDAMQRRTETFRQGVVDLANGIDQELDISSNRSKSSWGAIRNVLGEMENRAKNSSQAFLEYFSKYREYLSQSTTVKCGVAINMLNALELRQKNCHAEMEAYVNLLKSIEEKNRENFTCLVDSVKTQERSNRDNMEKYTEVNREFSQQLKEHHEVILGVRNAEMQRRVEENVRKMKELAQMCQTIAEENNSILTLVGNNAKDKETIDAKSNQFDTHVEDYRENFLNHQSTVAMDLENCEEQSKAIAEEHGEMVEKFREKKDGNIELLLEKIAQLRRELKSQRDCAQAEAVALEGKLEEHRGESLETFHSTTKAAVEIVDREEENVAMSQSAIKSITGQTRDSAYDFNDFFSSVVHQMQVNLENLETKDLKTYTSTGETPVRREFKYPRDLVATSPHERILNRFRGATANRVSTDTSECEQENFMELACMRLPLASTPIHDRSEDRTLRKLNSNESNKVLSAIGNKEQLVQSATIEISSDEENT